MTRTIDTDAVIERIRLQRQSAHFAGSPASGYSWLYQTTGTAHGGLFVELDTGEVIGPFITGSAAGSSVKDTLNTFLPSNNEPPSSNYATLDTRNQIPALEFDRPTDKSAVFSAILPRRYGGNGINVAIHWAAETSTGTSQICRWEGSFEARAGSSMDTDSFAAVQASGSNPSATLGGEVITTLLFTDGAQIDSLSAGGLYRLKVSRDADQSGGTDNMTGTAQLLAIEVRETP